MCVCVCVCVCIGNLSFFCSMIYSDFTHIRSKPQLMNCSAAKQMQLHVLIFDYELFCSKTNATSCLNL